ncbi:unnamed protein product [Symbiodinium sp. CCMP2592]|nr:unnamed protein product [Symbiodinium sp. CCMP2592]
MDLLDLTPDDSKTYTWAVQPGSRKQLQALGLPTCTHARELGGVLSFGRATRNAALVEHCHDTAELFARLRRSPAPLRHTVFALPRKVWARALHGISICPLSEAQVHSLRCSAVKALRVCPAGCSALLRLSIHSDLEADPSFYQLWVVVRDLCPDLSGNFASTATGPGIQHLFTDGSCIYPDLPELALASWGTVNASSGQLIGSGPVPGLAQTIPRAEMWAAICSLKWGLFCLVSVIIWSDSAYVVRGIRAILANAFVLPRENSDLWALIFDLTAQYDPGTLQAQHVPSHIDVQACDSPLDEWLAFWNDKADRLGAHANGNRGLKLAGARQAAVSFYFEQTAILEALFLVYSRIADSTSARAKRPHNEPVSALQTRFRSTGYTKFHLHVRLFPASLFVRSLIFFTYGTLPPQNASGSAGLTWW